MKMYGRLKNLLTITKNPAYAIPKMGFDKIVNYNKAKTSALIAKRVAAGMRSVK